MSVLRLMSFTAVMGVVVLVVPDAWVFVLSLYLLMLAEWIYNRSIFFYRRKKDRARCRCCSDGYPVIWVERMTTGGYWCDPEFHLCADHRARWLRITTMESIVFVENAA